MPAGITKEPSMKNEFRFPTARTVSRPARLARQLGWFSIALGVAELAAPRLVNRVCGLRARDGMVRLYGLREIACGAAILAGRDPKPWLWARVGGDVVDLASLAMADKAKASAGRTSLAAMNVAAIAALDVYAARYHPPLSPPASRYDYSDRSGLPGLPDAMRGAARKDFDMPADMRVPPALAPWDFDGNGPARRDAAHGNGQAGQDAARASGDYQSAL
jgi:hypothetical protein